MNNPLGVSPSNGNQGTTRGKEKIFWPRWESNPQPPTELRGRTEKVGDDLGGESRRRESKGQKNFFVTSCGSLIPFTNANGQWVFHGILIAL